MTELDALPWDGDDGRTPNGARGRRPASDPTPERRRRGRLARRSGNDAERDLARRLGGRRVGQLGTSVDVEVPGYMVVQSKRGGSFPERLWRLVAALPHDGRLRAVYLSDAPGVGHDRRELLVIPLDDWLAWHGPERTP